MPDSQHWGPSRYLAFFLVLFLHVLLVIVVWQMPTTLRGSEPQAPPAALQIVLLPPHTYPKLKVQINIARLLGGNAAITVEPPHLEGTASTAVPGPADPNSGSHDGVDWAAEARREMQAMEIRRDRNPGINTVSMRMGEDYWMFHAEHFPGDRLKNANDDWIVWLNDDCYTIATATPTHATTDMVVHQSICRERERDQRP